MIKKLMGSIREYKKESLQVPLYVTGEALIESLIPFIVAQLVNRMKVGCELIVIVHRPKFRRHHGAGARRDHRAGEP